MVLLLFVVFRLKTQFVLRSSQIFLNLGGSLFVLKEKSLQWGKSLIFRVLKTILFLEMQTCIPSTMAAQKRGQVELR
ncbi:hypothetical protein HRI_004753500 [Hibiscus trionum]|uniref:Uncharacterized protein n=1 Tax=Hibiscus trionum TaxID=183268 RepID=A0A9W7JDJ3_HIBTR|nr:hypothetical protein HRI_004753500 [Hibiscus trionum]